MNVAECEVSPTDPRAEEEGDQEWFEIPERVCLECGKPLDDDEDYEICEECLHGKSCRHGTPLSQVCNQCCVESDLAFDTWRERR